MKVTIAGQSYSVRTDAKPAYIRKLAAYVTDKMGNVASQGRIATTQSQAVLAALTIADELHQERESTSELKRDVRERSKRILRYLDRGQE